LTQLAGQNGLNSSALDQKTGFKNECCVAALTELSGRFFISE